MNRKELTKYLKDAQDEGLYGSLAAHDRRFHPNGYREGDSCELREKLDATDKPDNIEQDNGDPNERTTRLAPNGKRSNLTNRQYDQVRTPEFKKWFGDWENDPANASKVVDENGEPMVVYHGTRNFGFTKFNNISDMNFGIHLGTKRSADERIPNSPRGNNIGIYVVYANIKNPLYLPDVFGSVGQLYNYIMASRRETDRGVYDNGKLYGKHELDHSGIFKDTPELKTVRDAYNAVFEMIPFNGKVGIEANKLLNDAYLKYLQSLGFDGVRYVNAIEGKGDESVIAFNSSQIKSATDNKGSFSVESDDIRDEAKGKVKKYLDACVEDKTATRRLCLISDIHETPMTSLDAKDADIVVIAGDFMGGGNDSDDAGAAFLLDRFFPWCRKNADKKIVLTAGNHDKFLYRLWERRAEIDWPKNVTYLIDEPATVDGLKFYGTPWCRKDREGRFELDDKTLKYMFDKIPSDLDVLIVHTPPSVKGSNIDWSDWADEHEGSSELASVIRDKQPRLVVCGHVHGGSRRPVMVGKSKVINVARVKDHRDSVAYEPTFVDLPVRK